MNPKDLGVPREYILQHERIHFAIVELEARRMNASVEDLQPERSVTARSLTSGSAVVTTSWLGVATSMKTLRWGTLRKRSSSGGRV